MKYYGDHNIKRGYVVGRFDDNISIPSSPLGYLYSSGKIKEFIEKRLVPKGKFPDSCNDEKYEFINIKDVFDTVNCKGGEYYIVCRYNSEQGRSETVIYSAESPVGKGGLFKTKDHTYKFTWRKNSKYNTLEMKIARGNFEFYCVHRDSGNGSIDVKYTACDNRHRNNVTIARIDLESPSNWDYIKAIYEWIDQFKEELKAA